jgi:hypothetical protein
MDEIREQMQEKCSDTRERQTARLVIRTGLRGGYAFEDADMPWSTTEYGSGDEGNGGVLPGIFGGVTRPGGTGTRPR